MKVINCISVLTVYNCMILIFPIDASKYLEEGDKQFASYSTPRQRPPFKFHLPGFDFNPQIKIPAKEGYKFCEKNCNPHHVKHEDDKLDEYADDDCEVTTSIKHVFCSRRKSPTSSKKPSTVKFTKRHHNENAAVWTLPTNPYWDSSITKEPYSELLPFLTTFPRAAITGDASFREKCDCDSELGSKCTSTNCCSKNTRQKIILKISPCLGEIPIVILRDKYTSGVSLSLVDDIPIDDRKQLLQNCKNKEQQGVVKTKRIVKAQSSDDQPKINYLFPPRQESQDLNWDPLYRYRSRSDADDLNQFHIGSPKAKTNSNEYYMRFKPKVFVSKPLCYRSAILK